MTSEKNNTTTGRPSSRPPLGLNRGELFLSTYRDEWPALYETEKKIIASAIGKYVNDIQHVGSTAVAGLHGKPILDIAIAVTDYETARVCIEPLIELGYTFRGENGIPRRHYLQKGEPCTHHIHIVEESSEEWTKLIQFRDFLRSDQGVAKEYAKLKAALVNSLARDRKAYQSAKASFIESVVRRARKARD